MKLAFARGYHYQGQPVIISEYGGIAFQDGQTGWGYGSRAETREAFADRYEKITAAIKQLPYVCGYCYTQLTDVQQEINGLMDIRRQYKIEPSVIREINDKRENCLVK